MDHRGPRHLRGVDNAVDQVKRPHRVRGGAPGGVADLVATSACDWHAERLIGEAESVTAYDLKGLLDELEAGTRAARREPVPGGAGVSFTGSTEVN